MNGLTLKNISKSFGANKVIDNLSLELAGGELLVLLGPSGCGKSTLLRIIAGLETADEGEIYIGAKRVDKLLPKNRNVAMVFQNYSLYPHMSVEKNLAFPLKIAKIEKTESKERVLEVAQLLGLEEKLQAHPAELSGGQRQRVALGRAIIRRPDIFLLDEPLSNLDADLRSRLRREIVRIQQNINTTTVHVTHDQAEALTMADRIALLDQGRIIQLGTPQELYANPNSIYAARFIGYPRINLIDGDIFETKLVPFGFELDSEILNKLSQPFLIGLRPEKISSGGGRFFGEVSACEYFGEQYLVTIRFNEITLTMSGCLRPLEKNSEISFTVDPTDLLFFDKNSGQRIY